MQINSKILSNQFKVIYAIDNSNPLISLQLHIKIGSAWELVNEAGYSHFTEHLVFKSTERFPASSLMEEVTFLGGNMNAYTEYDSTCYYITLPSRFLDKGLEILAELVQHADYSLNDFNAEKKVIIEELKQFQNDPEDFFIESVVSSYFKRNPYGKPIIGNLKSLERADRDDLLKFYRKYYLPNNSFLVATGDFDSHNLLELVRKHFSGWKSRRLALKKPQPDKQPEKPVFRELPCRFTNNMLAFVLPDLSDANPDSYALSIAAKIFAVGKNSRLYERLFHKEKLMDTLKVNSISGINDGINIILVMPKQNIDMIRIIEVFLHELNLLYLFGLTELEIRETKKEMIHYYRYALEYVESLGSSIGSEELLTGYENFKRYPALIRKIKSREIEEVIKKYYNPRSLYIFHGGSGKLPSEKINTMLQKPVVKKKNKLSALDFSEIKMDNGLKIILNRVKGKPTIGICLSNAVSQLQETYENLGINLMTSGLLLYGNEKRDYGQFLNFCTSNGINCGISPQLETTSIKMKCFREMLPISLELLADVITTPLFSGKHLENLKSTYISNLDRVKDYPQYLAAKLWKEMIFGKRSNLLNIEGTKTSIRKITRNQVLKWFSTYYGISGMNLTIVGEFDFNYVLDLCDKLFSNLPSSPGYPQQKLLYQPSEVKYRTTNHNSNQAIINLGGFGCNLNEVQNNTAFHVLAQIIGGDTNSILFKELREKHGLAYSIEFDFRSIRDLGYFLITAIVDREKRKLATEMIISVLNNIKDNGIGEEELIKTRNFIRGQRLMDEESMMTRAITLSTLDAIGFGYHYYQKRDERLSRVTLTSLHQQAQKYFEQDRFFLHILS